MGSSPSRQTCSPATAKTAAATHAAANGRHVSARQNTATEIAGRLPVTRQAVAKHLVALDQAGLVTAERAGREVRYRLTPRPMTEAMSWMADVGAEWDVRLERLRRHLKR